MRRILWLVALLCGFTLLAGCSNSQSGRVYTREQAKMSHNVIYGTVQRVEPVTIEGTKSGLGAVGGGIAGGILGSTIGGGRGSALIAVGGAIAGAVAGSAAEEKMTTRPGVELEVHLEGGGVLLVVQGVDETFAVGDRVRVMQGADGSTRVRH
ncbi:MAG: hypothetical protein A2091_12175 [Desulfuromonadales bacterium GWD2_61_12]|nr:MAG: hypothetical protein A2005_00025 [Desulfuromonadales bacterium GWC2_61_20]OGR36881.1 MAG: hypothetical protein A2091_12175 [Desulfuromonadales bacterium GWD2_61_12]